MKFELRILCKLLNPSPLEKNIKLMSLTFYNIKYFYFLFNMFVLVSLTRTFTKFQNENTQKSLIILFFLFTITYC